MTINITNFKTLYKDKIKQDLKNQFQYKNDHMIPYIKKIIVSTTSKEAVTNPKDIANSVKDLADITGQKPIVTKAKKSIANFKLREGMSIGCKVTLRRHMMFSFLERFVLIALPRVKDFKGLSSKSFDTKGNLSIGIKEHLIFPEINYDKIDKIKGLNITIVTSAQSPLEAQSLLSGFYLPFLN